MSDPIKATPKSKYNTFLEVDLNKVFEGAVPDNSSFRQAVGQAIIDIIVERTDDNEYLSTKGTKGNPTPSTYSKEYASTLGFAAFGKSKGDVNLTQTGEMLGGMDIIKESSSSITIGWTDSEDRAKAANHNGGITVPKREFLGLKGSEVDKIREQFSTEVGIVGSEDQTASSVDKLQAFIKGEFDIPTSDTKQSVFASLFSGLGLTGGDGG